MIRKNNDKYYKILNKVSDTFISKPKRYDFNIFYYTFLEIYLKKYFEKLIISTLLSEDNIVEFLDKNEFGMQNNIIYKKDIIEPDSIFDNKKITEAELLITNEIEQALLSEIDKSNINIDIENFINVFTEIEVDDNDNKIYTTQIRYYRLYIIHRNITKIKSIVKKLGIIFSILILVIAFILYNFYG